MEKKLQHNVKSHGEEVTIDVETDADIKDMHKKDADANDAKKHDLVQTSDTFETVNDDSVFQVASDCDREMNL